ncbi:MAG TPA: aquaporin [Chitinophagaceae bacterium]|nr:aquaporin [Chitinophagaceae bacterium]
MPIRVYSEKAGLVPMRASFKKNWVHYLREALGLAIFMISACFFGAVLEAKDSSLHLLIPSAMLRSVISGVLMALTALFIFYSPLTSPSGSHINPAVTLSFLRTGKMCPWDALFFIIFQFAGAVIAVYLMQIILGHLLTNPPVNSAVTIPGTPGRVAALATEFGIAFITMSVVLFTSENSKLKRYTRIFAACLVCACVIAAGPISGFGMNPARSFASALAAKIWTGFWIYLTAPLAGMLSATEVFLFTRKNKSANAHKERRKNGIPQPYEFEL